VVHLHFDQLGSIVLATGATGNVLGERSYYASGLEHESAGFVDTFGFTGQAHEPSSGLIHFAARDLDPLSGRWDADDPAFAILTPESAGATGESTAGYAYVGNETYDETDPSGLMKWSTFKKGALSVGRHALRGTGKKAIKAKAWHELKRLANRIVGRPVKAQKSFSHYLDQHTSIFLRNVEEGKIRMKVNPKQEVAQRILFGSLRAGLWVGSKFLQLPFPGLSLLITIPAGIAIDKAEERVIRALNRKAGIAPPPAKVKGESAPTPAGAPSLELQPFPS
jgi:RHS repeat-associated protein